MTPEQFEAALDEIENRNWERYRFAGWNPRRLARTCSGCGAAMIRISPAGVLRCVCGRVRFSG